MAVVQGLPALASANGKGPGGRPPTRPKGASGTRNYQGIIHVDEMTPEFRGKQLFRTVDRMVRSDPVVRAALLMVALPLREAEWTISPAGSKPEDREAAELVRRALLEHNDWPQVVWDVVSSGLKYGRGVVEEAYEAVDWELSYDVDETTEEVPRRTYWVPRRYGSRLAKTIERWHVDDEGDLTHVVQQLPTMDGRRGTAQLVELDADQLVVWVNERDGDNYEGTSMFRPMFRNWYAKEKLEIIDAIRAERAGVGVPVGWAGDGDEEKLEEALKGLRVNEEGFIVLTGDPPGGKDHHQAVEMLDMRAASTANLGESLHYHTTQILWAILGAWQQLGQGNVGARATSETQDDPFYLLVSSVARSFAAAFNRQAIPRLIAYNYAGLDRCPQLTVGSLPGADFGSMVEGMSKLLTAGGLTNDLELENFIRRKMGMPERKPEEAAPEVTEGEPSEELPPGTEPTGDEESDDPTQQGGPTSEGEPAQDDPQLEVKVPEHKRKLPSKAKTAGRRVREALTALVRAEAPAAIEAALRPGAPGVVAGGAATEEYTTTMADGSTFTTWRPLTELETHVLFQATDSTITDMRREYESAAREEVGKLAAFAAGTVAGSGSIDQQMIDRAEAALAERLGEVLSRVAAFGRVAVRSEISSQRGVNRPALTVDGAEVALVADPPRNPERLDDWIRRVALGSARAVTTRVSLAASRGGARLGALPQETLLARVSDAGRAALKAEGVATVAHALQAGRRAEAEEAKERGESAGSAVYSAVLDAATCGPCRSLDGDEYEVGSSAYERDYPPLYACDGQDACRCLMIVEATSGEVLDEEETDPTAG